MQQPTPYRNVVNAPIPIHIGAFLKMLRDRHGITQIQVLKHLPFWDQSVYSRVEKDKVAPAFEQLPHIYNALHLAGVELTLQDRQQYLLLTRRKIEAMKTRHENKTDSDWEKLRVALAQIDRLPVGTESQEHTHKPRISGPRFAETRHLVGREDWLESILASMQVPHLKKLVIIQGAPGMGKSSELNRLASYLLQKEIPRYKVLSCVLPAEDHRLEPEFALDELLGTLLVELGPRHESIPPSFSLDERILFVLGYLERSAGPIVVFIDNAENMFDGRGALAPCWEQFLMRYLRCQHQASLVLATSEWHGWYTGEKMFVAQTMLPPLTTDEGVVLLQHLGLSAIPVEYLRAAVEAVGGVPQCLEWVTSLVQEPMLLDEWDEIFDQHVVNAPDESVQTDALVRRLSRLLEDPSLFSGPIATKLQPLLKRVIEQRLSSEARATLHVLAVSPLPLGKPALQVLCPHPAALRELRDASFLAAYPHRVQLLPMVASTIVKQLSPAQVQAVEEQLIRALTHWLNEGIVSGREQGKVIAELSSLLLRHHQLLTAAELLLYHGWLSFQAGFAPRLAKMVQEVLGEFDWRGTPATESGGLLLHYFMMSYLGIAPSAREQAEAAQQIRLFVLSELVNVEPLMEIHLVHLMMQDEINGERFEQAQSHLDECVKRMRRLEAVGDGEIHAMLLSKQAWLYSLWSSSLEAQGQREEARRLRDETIELYEQCVHLLERYELEKGITQIRQSTLKKKCATFLNNLSFHLNRARRFEDALRAVDQSIQLKELGYVEFGSLAASYGEKSQILAELGRFREAMQFDEMARAEVQRYADAGDAMSQEETWIYQVNQGRLYLRLGRVDEAEHLLQKALDRIEVRRKVYQIFAREALMEITQWRLASPRYQLDWRWIERYRTLSAYDAYWWWAAAGSFTEEEQRQWDRLYLPYPDEATKERLAGLLVQSRQRELLAAIAEHREPHLHYPALESEIEDVRQRITGFLQLDTDVGQQEPNAIVRRLYRGAIEDEVYFLSMIEATYEGNSERFWELSRQLNPEPTSEEMRYALFRVGQVIRLGLQREDTADVSRRVMQVAREQFQLSLDPADEEEVAYVIHADRSAASSYEQRMVSPQAAKRFFETVLRENGYDGWQVTLDPNASGPRVESGLRQLFLQEDPIALEEIREYFSHELLGHIERSVAGENSPLGLLGLGTKGYLSTEEGLADYYERIVAALHGQNFDDSGVWLGTLAVGLASGVVGHPQTFSTLYAFFTQFLLLYRLLWRNDEDRQTAEGKAQKLALARCLRTYRGLPDLERDGICNTRDVVYLRGYLKIKDAVEKDETVLDHLSVGKVALELLPGLQELRIAIPERSLRKLAYDPGLDDYILSFEDEVTVPGERN